MKSALLGMLLLVCGAGASRNKICPVWMSVVWYNHSVQRCDCVIPSLKCVNESYLELQDQFCLSYDANSQLVVSGVCPYSYYQQGYVRTLNSSVN